MALHCPTFLLSADSSRAFTAIPVVPTVRWRLSKQHTKLLVRNFLRSQEPEVEITDTGAASGGILSKCVKFWTMGRKGALTWAVTSLFCVGVVNVLPHPEVGGWEMLSGSLIDGAQTFNLRVSPAHAGGLLLMPPVKLNNRYYLVRAGESEFETRGIINTNPVAKTSIDNGLSEEGKRQTARAAKQLKALGACDGSCWIWASITQRAYQTAEIIAYFSNITRSRIVPEYSFLDARGLGAYEGRQLASATEVYDTDALSTNLRPPPFTDGTPNESVADVLVRVTQLMSILETQYFGETIVIVSPDSDNLSVLQAGLTGLDLRRHSQLAFVPGEVRLLDPGSLPPPRPPVSGLIKCTGKPPVC